jgi:hypothetical protein
VAGPQASRRRSQRGSNDSACGSHIPTNVGRACSGSIRNSHPRGTATARRRRLARGAHALEEARLTNDITSLKARIGAAKSERKRLEKMLAVGRRDQLRTEPMLPVDTTALKN